MPQLGLQIKKASTLHLLEETPLPQEAHMQTLYSWLPLSPSPTRMNRTQTGKEEIVPPHLRPLIPSIILCGTAWLLRG